MTATFFDRNQEESRDQARSRWKLLPDCRSVARILRSIAVIAPLILFAAATLAGLGFFATMLPFLGMLSLALVLTAGVLSILVAAFLPNL